MNYIHVFCCCFTRLGVIGCRVWRISIPHRPSDTLEWLTLICAESKTMNNASKRWPAMYESLIWFCVLRRRTLNMRARTSLVFCWMRCVVECWMKSWLWLSSGPWHPSHRLTLLLFMYVYFSIWSIYRPSVPCAKCKYLRWQAREFIIAVLTLCVDTAHKKPTGYVSIWLWADGRSTISVHTHTHIHMHANTHVAGNCGHVRRRRRRTSVWTCGRCWCTRDVNLGERHVITYSIIYIYLNEWERGRWAEEQWQQPRCVPCLLACVCVCACRCGGVGAAEKKPVADNDLTLANGPTTTYCELNWGPLWRSAT